MNPRTSELVRLLRWVVAAAVLVAVVVYGITSQETSRYKATSSAQVISGPQSAGQYEDQNSLLQLTNYYLAQAQASPVALAAAKALGHGVTARRLGDAVSVTALLDSQELQVTATSQDPAQAAAWANAYLDEFARQVAAQQTDDTATALTALQTRIAGLQSQLQSTPAASALATSITSQLEALQGQAVTTAARPKDVISVIQPAMVPTSASSPRPAREAGLALIVVILVGLALAYGARSYSNHYRSAEEVALETGLVPLGEIPHLPLSDPMAVEAFRALRTSVEFLASDLVGPSYVFTSASAGAGKTHVVTNLAGALATSDLRVVIVDGDLRRPAVHERLRIARTPGFADALVQRHLRRPLTKQQVSATPPVETAPGGARSPASALDVVPAGVPLNDPSSVLATDSASDLIRLLRRAYDVVLIDSPPMVLSDAAVLARHTSGVILVIDARHDRRSAVQSVIERLVSLQIPVAGFVFNGTKPLAARDRYYETSMPARRSSPAKSAPVTAGR